MGLPIPPRPGPPPPGRQLFDPQKEINKIKVIKFIIIALGVFISFVLILS